MALGSGLTDSYTVRIAATSLLGPTAWRRLRRVEQGVRAAVGFLAASSLTGSATVLTGSGLVVDSSAGGTGVL